MTPQQYVDTVVPKGDGPQSLCVLTCIGCGFHSHVEGHRSNPQTLSQCSICGVPQLHDQTNVTQDAPFHQGPDPEFKKEFVGEWNEEKPPEVPMELDLGTSGQVANPESGTWEDPPSEPGEVFCTVCLTTTPRETQGSGNPELLHCPTCDKNQWHYYRTASETKTMESGEVNPIKNEEDAKKALLELNGIVGEWEMTKRLVTQGPDFPLWIDPDYIRPSSLKFRRLCPNFRQNEEDPERMEAANQGTRIHLAMETGDTDPLEEDDLPLYDWAVDKRKEVIHDAIPNFTPQSVNSFKEVRFEGLAKDPETGKKRYEGMVDEIMLLDPYGAVMLDYKFGEWKVDPPEFNDQMKDYISKAFKKWKHLRWIRCVIIAPKRGEAPEHTFYREELPTINRQISAIRGRAVQDITKPNRHCNWCAKVGNCPKLWKHMEPLTSGDSGLPIVKPEWNLDKPMDLGHALRIRPVVKAMLEKWCDEVKTTAIEVMDEGFEVNGFYKIMRKGKRKIVHLDKMTRKAKELGCTDEEISELTKVSMKGIVDLVRSKAPRGQKKIVEEQLMDFLKESGALAYDESYPVIQQAKE